MQPGHTYDNGYNVVCSEIVNKLYIMFVMLFTLLFGVIQFGWFFREKVFYLFLQEEEDLLLFFGRILEGLALELINLCN